MTQSRSEMASLLNERMNRTYTSLSERQELEPDTTLVKTFLLEAHLDVNAIQDQVLTTVYRAFADEVFGQRLHLEVSQAREPTLIILAGSLNRERVLLYLDVSNSRFWLLHSMSSSNALNWIIARVTNRSQELDRAWMPSQLLESISKLGSFRGLGLDYDRRAIPDVDFESPDAPVEYLKMQLWGSKASEILRILREQGAFPNETTLSKVKIKAWLTPETPEEFTVDDVKYDGKITARGTSFQSHISVVSTVYAMYAQKVLELEQSYALGTTVTDGTLTLSGASINFMFGRPIRDLDIFCSSIFTSSPPFKLWGIPTRLGNDYYRVKAVDMHVGSRLDMEITSNFMRVYLPVGSCGNSVLRLYTNLQHHYDSKLGAVNGDGESIFEF